MLERKTSDGVMLHLKNIGKYVVAERDCPLVKQWQNQEFNLRKLVSVDLNSLKPAMLVWLIQINMMQT
jgi:hypothetical protein